jgi:hypothetical protein
LADTPTLEDDDSRPDTAILTTVIFASLDVGYNLWVANIRPWNKKKVKFYQPYVSQFMYSTHLVGKEQTVVKK